jgi:hypothetical protein
MPRDYPSLREGLIRFPSVNLSSFVYFTPVKLLVLFWVVNVEAHTLS